MCGAESLNARMGVQPRDAEVDSVTEPRESLRMLFGVGASVLNKWFKATRTGASLVVEVIAPVITALHDLPARADITAAHRHTGDSRPVETVP
jgi:hypothetical protein